MQPLQNVLHRIRWDPKFAKGTFALGYYDRIRRCELTVPFSSVSFETNRPGTFSIRDEDDEVRQIPLHRVRTVYKDGAVIWQRGPFR